MTHIGSQPTTVNEFIDKLQPLYKSNLGDVDSSPNHPWFCCCEIVFHFYEVGKHSKK